MPIRSTVIIFIEARDSWYRKILTKQEFAKFVADSLTGQFKENQQACIGEITSEASARIMRICGKRVRHIMASSSAIIHAYSKVSHNLAPTDILHLVEVVNTTKNIKISADSFRSEPGAAVLEFEMDIKGDLKFIELVRISKKYKGWLDLVTCYRKRKVKDA
jgi:uncharacterized protein YjaZ